MSLTKSPENHRHPPGHGQARHSDARHGRGRDDVHGRGRGDPQGDLEAHRFADADGHHSPRQAHRRAHAAHQGVRAARQARGHRVRRLGPLPRRRLPGGHQGRRAVERAPRRAQGLPLDHQADEGGLRAGLRQEADGDPRQDRQEQARPGGAGDRRHQGVQEEEQLRPAGDGLVRLDRGLPQPRPVPRHAGLLRKGADRERSRDLAVADLRLRGAQAGRPLRQRRAQPDRRHAGAHGAGQAEQRADRRQGLQDRPDAHEDDPRAGLQGAPARRRGLVLDQHPRQPRRRGARRSGVVQDEGGLEARRARAHPAAAPLPRPLRQHVPRRAHQLLPAARRQQRGLGQHRHLRVDGLPDADQDRLPLPGLDPGGADRPRPRAVHGPRAALRDDRHPGVAVVLLEEPADARRASTPSTTCSSS